MTRPTRFTLCDTLRDPNIELQLIHRHIQMPTRIVRLWVPSGVGRYYVIRDLYFGRMRAIPHGDQEIPCETLSEFTPMQIMETLNPGQRISVEYAPKKLAFESHLSAGEKAVFADLQKRGRAGETGAGAVLADFLIERGLMPMPKEIASFVSILDADENLRRAKTRELLVIQALAFELLPIKTEIRPPFIMVIEGLTPDG